MMTSPQANHYETNCALQANLPSWKNIEKSVVTFIYNLLYYDYKSKTTTNSSFISFSGAQYPDISYWNVKKNCNDFVSLHYRF